MKKILRTLSWRVVPLGVAILILSNPLLLADSTGTVARSSNLRKDHDSSAPLVKPLAASTPLTVLDTNPQNGYLHVRTAEGDEGWVLAANVTAGAQRQPAHHPTPFAARAAKARSRSSGPCAA